ncbi:YdcF family protein [Pseudodesulfovibrio sp.]|uniref:YdcF family protein n=1 Tax=unclassified Pseudodesulfovibrio TaxID=2661612 RepID=UPI003B00AC12
MKSMRVLRFVLQCIGAVTVIAFLAGWGLLAFAGSWMRVEDPPVKSDYILPLAGEDARWLKASELYNEGYAPIILDSLAKPLPKTRMDHVRRQMGFPQFNHKELIRRILQIAGAGKAPLEPFGHGHISTVEEAEALRRHFQGRTPSLLIVTSPYHARRAKMIFGDVLPNCRVTVVSTSEDQFGKNWWRNQKTAQLLVMEFAKTVYYLFGGVYRSTDTSPSSESEG